MRRSLKSKCEKSTQQRACYSNAHCVQGCSYCLNQGGPLSTLLPCTNDLEEVWEGPRQHLATQILVPSLHGNHLGSAELNPMQR